MTAYKPLIRDQMNHALNGRTGSSGLFSSFDWFKLTTAEDAAGVTPVNYAYPPGDVRRYGADPSGTNDSYAAFVAAINASNQTIGFEIKVPEGTYLLSQKLEVGYTNLHMVGYGRATLKHSGTDTKVISCDAGAGTLLYGHTLENLTIEGNGTANQVGFYARNVLHRVMKNIRVRNTSSIGFRIDGDVLSKYEDCYVSDNEQAFTYTPDFGFYLDSSADVSAVADCVFVNCAVECSNNTGWYVHKADGCTFLNGTSEGLVGTTGNNGLGILCDTTTNGNMFINMFCEANFQGGDLVDYGKRNRHINCTYNSRAASAPFEAVKSIVIKSSAEQVRLEGIELYAATIESGAKDTIFHECDSGYAIADSGTRTEITHTRQLFNTSTIIAGPMQASFTPTFGGSTGNGTLTHNIQIGNAYLVNGTCFFTLKVRVSVVTAAPTGDLYIRGLPYTPASGYEQAVTISLADNFVFPVGKTQLHAEVVDGVAAIRFPVVATSTTTGYVQGSTLVANTIVTISGHYLVAP